MAEPPGDPRVFFAAERTLLAWLRTGITLMAFGFVVARFGLFLSLMRRQGIEVHGTGLSPYLGAVLILLGAASIAGGTIEFRRFSRTVRPADLPEARSPLLPLAMAWILVALGIVLATNLFL
jgi:putative membrane protein